MEESREVYRKGFNAVSSKTGEKIICTDLAFTTTHPPDVSQRSRIVAVCGITDYDNLADPRLDGWFFSDFYLFHHLFNPLHVRTSSQIWLTCVDPAHLVAKYGEYAHGDPRNERRTVLEEALLPDIHRAGNIRVVDRLVLLERFVKTVEEQAREAKKNSEHLIILIFGHDQDCNYGVYIGSANLESDRSVLQVQRLKQAIPRGLNTTLLLTSCYSGGWLVQPDVNYNRRLNVTGIAASGPTEETLSWPMSDSVGRASGSTIASAILSQLIDIEEKENAEDDPSSHPTYIDFATSVYDKAITFDTFFKDQNVHFSAQDDDWEAHWKSRTGIPLARLKERWECLRQIPPSGTKSTGGEHSLANRQTGSLQRDLHHFAVEYLNARPGRNNVPSNHTLYARLNMFFEGDPASCTTERVQGLLNSVVYRLNMMADADEYVKAMGFKYPSCLGFSVEDHELSDSQMESRHAALNYMIRVKLFPRMPRVDFPHFKKPENYLAIVLTENCKSEADMKLRVDRALFWKQVRDTTVLPHVQAGKIVNDHHVRAKLHACVSALRDIGHRIHVKTNLLTASHRGYSAVPTEDVPTP